MELEGFEVFDFSEGVPYASITKNGVSFNSAAIKKLGSPAFVRLLINYNTKQFAVQSCDGSTEKAVRFFKEKKSGVISVRWNGRDLLNNLSELMKWNLSLESFRVEGSLLKEMNAMVFDLNAAKRLD